jgi:hypothetical protein
LTGRDVEVDAGQDRLPPAERSPGQPTDLEVPRRALRQGATP